MKEEETIVLTDEQQAVIDKLKSEGWTILLSVECFGACGCEEMIYFKSPRMKEEGSMFFFRANEDYIRRSEQDLYVKQIELQLYKTWIVEQKKFSKLLATLALENMPIMADVEIKFSASYIDPLC